MKIECCDCGAEWIMPYDDSIFCPGCGRAMNEGVKSFERKYKDVLKIIKNAKWKEVYPRGGLGKKEAKE